MDSLTSFPQEGIVDNRGDQPALTGLYNRMRTVIHNVLPGNNGQDEETDTINRYSGLHYDESSAASHSSSGKSIDTNTNTNTNTNNNHEMVAGSPVRYLKDAWPVAFMGTSAPIMGEQNVASSAIPGAAAAYMASPTVSNVTKWENTDDDDEASVASYGHSRSGSVTGRSSMNFGSHNHLPGFAIASDDEGSDSESITSTYRDYMISQLTRKHKTLQGGLSKEFWMKDENAAECFRCSAPFTGKYSILFCFCLQTILTSLSSSTSLSYLWPDFLFSMHENDIW